MSPLKRYFQFQSWSLRHALLYTGVVLGVSLSGLPDAWALQVSPTSLSFQAVQGGSNPTSQTVNVFKSNNHTVGWSATDNAAWLSISPTSGSITGSAQISASVNPAGLAAGTYTATVTITTAQGGSTSVPVTLTVTAAPAPPAIGTSPTSLSFTAWQGGSNPAAQTVSISNTGGGTLSWSASDNMTWLILSPTSGTGNGTVTLNATTGTLTAGSYSGTVTLSATGATPVSVPVTFTVTAAPVPLAIGTSPTSFSFTATQGGTNPAAQSLNISNTGGGTLSWSVSDNAAWLTLSPTTGTGNGSATLSVTTGSLAAGTYNAAITLTATGATNTPQTVPVTFMVTAPPASIGVSPVSLSFTATQGAANPANQSLTITNTGGGSLSWNLSDNANWLSLNPTSGSSTPGPVTASVNTSGLVAGIYNASITVTATGATNTPQTVPVSLVVTAPSTGTATLTWNASTSSGVAGYKVYQATASGAYGAPIAALQGNVLGYTAAGLARGTTYFFVVTSYNQAGTESLHSNEVSTSIY